MRIDKVLNGNELKLNVSGRLDTVTAPELETVIKNELAGVETLVFDLEKLEYISSAGLRVLLSAQKIMSKQGRMIIRNAGESIMEVFEVTGFTDILTIE